MKSTQQRKAVALFSLGLFCAVSLAVIAGRPAATAVALQPAVAAPTAALAMERIPTVTIVGKRLRKTEEIDVDAMSRTPGPKHPAASRDA